MRCCLVLEQISALQSADCFLWSLSALGSWEHAWSCLLLHGEHKIQFGFFGGNGGAPMYSVFRQPWYFHPCILRGLPDVLMRNTLYDCLLLLMFLKAVPCGLSCAELIHLFGEVK